MFKLTKLKIFEEIAYVDVPYWYMFFLYLACGEDLNDLTLSKWRVKYQSEMHKVLMDIDSDVEVLKEKCLKLSTKFQQHGSGLVSAKIHY